MQLDLINARLARARVLLVDDSGFTRKILRTMLGRIGVQTVYEAESGVAGLGKLCAVSPDVVFLDWEMPDLSGGAFLKTVRSPGKFPYPSIPIIVVSAHREEKIVTEAFCAGVNEFLIKPVSQQSLRERLIQVIIFPRRTVQIGAYYGPEPRKGAALLQMDSSEPVFI